MGRSEIAQIKQSNQKFKPRLDYAMVDFQPDIIMLINSKEVTYGEQTTHEIKGEILIDLDKGTYTTTFDQVQIEGLEFNLSKIPKSIRFLEFLSFCNVDFEGENRPNIDGGVFVGNSQFMTSDHQPFPAYIPLDYIMNAKASVLEDHKILVTIDGRNKNNQEITDKFQINFMLVITGAIIV